MANVIAALAARIPPSIVGRVEKQKRYLALAAKPPQTSLPAYISTPVFINNNKTDALRRLPKDRAGAHQRRGVLDRSFQQVYRIDANSHANRRESDLIGRNF